MSHFFFDLCTPDGFERDNTGLSFDTLDEAYLSANQAAVDISIELLAERRDPTQYRFEIRDSTGTVVMEIPFSEVLHVGRARKPRDTAAIHDRLRESLERSRKLKKDLAEALNAARASALKGLALAQVNQGDAQHSPDEKPKAS